MAAPPNSRVRVRGPRRGASRMIFPPRRWPPTPTPRATPLSSTSSVSRSPRFIAKLASLSRSPPTAAFRLSSSRTLYWSSPYPTVISDPRIRRPAKVNSRLEVKSSSLMSTTPALRMRSSTSEGSGTSSSWQVIFQELTRLASFGSRLTAASI